MKNWGGNITYSTSDVAEPRTVDDVVNLVENARRIRPLGTRHSFNHIADTDGQLVSLAKMTAISNFNPDRRTVDVEPGVTFGQLAAYLQQHDFTLRNMPSLPHVSIVGAVQTGTHGSGTRNISADVWEVEGVSADGSIWHSNRAISHDVYAKCVLMKGLLGIVTRVRIRLRPMFQVQQDVYEDVPLADVLEDLERVMSAGYSVSLFTDWQRARVNQVWVKRDLSTAAPPLPACLNGRIARQKLHPIAGVDPTNCTEQGVPGPAHERLPHFRYDAAPSSAGNELQAEYFVARSDAPAALRAIADVGPALRDVLMISEVRTVLADDLRLSPACGRDSVAIHFTLQPDETAVRKVLTDVIEPALAPFQPRPHWGKLFCLSPEALRGTYPHLREMAESCKAMDPQGKFRTDFINRTILGIT